MRKSILILLLFSFCSLFAQTQTEQLVRGLALGMHIHTYGVGLDAMFIKQKTERRDRVLQFSLESLKNRKEIKIESLYKDQGGKAFIFDKINYAYTLSSQWGFQWKIIPFQSFSSLSCKVGLGAGPILAFLKPYYLEIAKPLNATQATIIVDQYNSEKYAYDDIVGEADYFRGFDHLKIIPGLRLKSSFALDFASSGLFIRAIHSGLTLDIYPKKLQIMDQTPNKQIYFGGFIGFLIGDLY